MTGRRGAKLLTIGLCSYALSFWLSLAILAPERVSAQLSGGVGGFPGPGTVHSAGGGYTGPGNVVSGAFAWYSCSRGYSTADTANACNVCLPADTTCADITLSAGFAVLPGSLSTCNITTVICTVKTLYDKTGNGRDVTQATEAARPRFRPAMASNNCPTTALPCMLFVGASSQSLSSSNVTLAQPVTGSVVYTRGATSGAFFSNNATTFYARSASGATVLNAGTDTGSVGTAANGSFHAFQGILNGASSAVFIDGTATTGLSAGTNGISTAPIQIGSAGGSLFFDGYLCEVGLWGSAFTTTGGGQADLMNSNQHGSNGYNF